MKAINFVTEISKIKPNKLEIKKNVTTQHPYRKLLVNKA